MAGYKVALKLPVNPIGFSFIKSVGGCLLREYGVNPSRELNKALQKLGHLIWDRVLNRDENKLVKVALNVDLENGVVTVEEVEIWEATKKVTDKDLLKELEVKI